VKLTLQRYPQPSFTPGILYVDGVMECFTLEWPHPEQGAKYACIPKGVYPVTLYSSPHFNRSVLRLSDVPGRTDIEIHPGNTLADTKGCILVGKGRSSGGSILTASGPALDDLVVVVTFPLTISVEEAK